MRQVSVSQRSTWTLWAVMASGVAVSSVDGLEAVGFTIWLVGVAAQWVLGINVLVNRRKARRQ